MTTPGIMEINVAGSSLFFGGVFFKLNQNQSQCRLMEEKHLTYPDRQLDLFLPPEQHPGIKSSHTLEEMAVNGKDFSSQHWAPVTDTISITLTSCLSHVCMALGDAGTEEYHL